ncbi:hypothetical protein JXM83_00525 [Candidatus Woesearchaeota archaeon]|nr:hypothetical protein [Candidatus Woesearchaeota archaeon]
MAKFIEAENRLFKNIFVCRKCKTKRRVPIMKVLAGKVSCRNCKSPDLRVVKKK